MDRRWARVLRSQVNAPTHEHRGPERPPEPAGFVERVRLVIRPVSGRLVRRERGRSGRGRGCGRSSRGGCRRRDRGRGRHGRGRGCGRSGRGRCGRSGRGRCGRSGRGRGCGRSGRGRGRGCGRGKRWCDLCEVQAPRSGRERGLGGKGCLNCPSQPQYEGARPEKAGGASTRRHRNAVGFRYLARGPPGAQTRALPLRWRRESGGGGAWKTLGPRRGGRRPALRRLGRGAARTRGARRRGPRAQKRRRLRRSRPRKTRQDRATRPLQSVVPPKRG
jgi:hypothetical protein